MFEIGKPVLCVDSSKLPYTVEELNADMPVWVKKGEKYKVRGFADNDGIVTGVYLEEIVNPIRFFKLLGRSQEGAFKLDRFVPLLEDEVEVMEEEFSEVL